MHFLCDAPYALISLRDSEGTSGREPKRLNLRPNRSWKIDGRHQLNHEAFGVNSQTAVTNSSAEIHNAARAAEKSVSSKNVRHRPRLKCHHRVPDLVREQKSRGKRLHMQR
jgi:hypothetical protein